MSKQWQELNDEENYQAQQEEDQLELENKCIQALDRVSTGLATKEDAIFLAVALGLGHRFGETK